MLVPHHRNPLSREQVIPLSRVLVTIWQLQKHPLFRAFSGELHETTAQNTPLSRENGNTHAGPLMHSSGRGGGAVLRGLEASYCFVVMQQTLVYLNGSIKELHYKKKVTKVENYLFSLLFLGLVVIGFLAESHGAAPGGLQQPLAVISRVKELQLFLQLIFCLLVHSLLLVLLYLIRRLLLHFFCFK